MHTHVLLPVGVGIVLRIMDTVPAVVDIQLTSVGLVTAQKEYVTGQFVLYTGFQ